MQPHSCVHAATTPPNNLSPDRCEISIPKLKVHATADLFPIAVEMHRAQGLRSLASAVLQDCRSSSAADIGGPSSRPLAQLTTATLAQIRVPLLPISCNRSTRRTCATGGLEKGDCSRTYAERMMVRCR